MRLRSGKLAVSEVEIPKRTRVRKMANQPNNPNESIPVSNPVPSAEGNIGSVPVSEAVPSSAGSIPAVSMSQNAPSSSFRAQQMPVGTPPPVGNTSRPFVTNFTMPLPGREQPFGMPTSVMANLHNSPVVYSDSMANMSSPLQGSGYGGNMSRLNQQPLYMPAITNNSAQVIRQQMDESNHDMVQMLTQQMGVVFNPLIQNTTDRENSKCTILPM